MGRLVVHWEFMSMEPARVSAFYENIFAKFGGADESVDW